MEETAVRTMENSSGMPDEANDQDIQVEDGVLQQKHQELTDSTLDTSKSSQNGSEYESIDSGGSSSEGEDDARRIHPQDLENEFEVHGSDSEGSLVLEREEGDGQESAPNKKVDDDEDKKNPQYIPKRGTFYEHDDRTLDDGTDKQENDEKGEKQSKKIVWMEKKERWCHDRYNDNEQAPKSRSELVSIYGYDIRNEDGPPRARRRRRYGRGPNKYTRTWEDEDAYKPTKPVGKTTPLKKPIRSRDEEYPPLRNQGRQSDEEAENDYESGREDEPLQAQNIKFSAPPVDNDLSTNDSSIPRQEIAQKKVYGSMADQPNNRALQQRVGTGRVIKPKPEVKREIKDSDYRGFTKTRQFRNSKSEQKILPKPQQKDKRDFSNNKETNLQDVERDLNKLNIQVGAPKSSNKQNNQRQTSVPPRLQAEQKASKRYSSLRQRSLPETAAPPFSQPANYYTNDYNQQAQTPQQQQGLLPQPNSIITGTPQVPQIAPPPLPLPQVPVTATSILQAPPQFAAPFPQAPPAFLQPAVPPPPFLPPQPPQIINYVQGQPPQFPQPPPPYQGYQHQQFNTVNQPAELYQCQGGTTYYSTQNQHLGQRLVPQKRPKAAIPILPPPPQEPRGRGRTNNQRETPPAGDELYENVVTNDNSNNFEDAAAVVVQQ